MCLGPSNRDLELSMPRNHMTMAAEAPEGEMAQSLISCLDRENLNDETVASDTPCWSPPRPARRGVIAAVLRTCVHPESLSAYQSPQRFTSNCLSQVLRG